jgi:hypothetical protein
MKVILSKTLTKKLKYLKGKMTVEGLSEVETYGRLGIQTSYPARSYIKVEIFLEDHPNPEYDLEQCKKWMEIINTYFTTSYNAYRVDVGSFKSIYPTEIYEDRICLRAEQFVHKPTWRDWFIPEGDKNVSEFEIFF